MDKPSNLYLDFDPYCEKCQWFDPADIDRVDIEEFNGDYRSEYYLRCLHRHACRRREDERSNS